MELIMGSKKVSSSEVKRPELKKGSHGPGSQVGAVLVEIVDNGYVLRLLSAIEESEVVKVFQGNQISELMEEIQKNL